MDLPTYIEDPERKAALAKALATSPTYLWQIATGWEDRKPSPAFAARIERATAELGPETVRCESMRQDVTFLRDASGRVTGYHTPIDEQAA